MIVISLSLVRKNFLDRKYEGYGHVLSNPALNDNVYNY